MFKNVAAKFLVYAYDSTTGLPKTGDAANLTAYVSKDYGSVTVLADTSATELDSTNAKGYYIFDAAQGETNADCLHITGKSSTSNIVVLGAPAIIYTRPTTGWLAPTVAARTLNVDASGRALSDLDTIKTQTVTCAAGVTINVNIGTTQPVNFTGTSSSALVKTDMIDVNSVAYGSSTLNTLASHDPGATLGTSTLTQTQVSGGAYPISSASFSFGANAINAAAIADGAIDRATFAADTGMQTVRSNTCQGTGNSANTVKLDAGAHSTDNYYSGYWFYATGGTGAGQVRRILSYDGTTKICTLDATPVYTWLFFDVPDATTTFSILPNASVAIDAMGAQLFPANFAQLTINGITGAAFADVRYWNGTAPLNLSSQQVQAVVPITQKVDLNTIKTNPVANAGTFTFPTNATGASTTNITAASGVALSSSERNTLAAVVLRRTMTNVQNDAAGDTVDKHSLYGFIQQAQKSTMSGGTLTIKNADGTTLGTLTFTSDATADPVTGVS